MGRSRTCEYFTFFYYGSSMCRLAKDYSLFVQAFLFNKVTLVNVYVDLVVFTRIAGTS